MSTLHVSLHVPVEVTHLILLLRAAGYEAYVVGGCVRDRLLGREPKDWDVTTNATPTQVKNVLQTTGNPRWTVVPTGEKYGTVTVIFRHAGDYVSSMEVTTYRTDHGYSDGRRPDSVTFGSSLEEDVWRRDFTISALAYDPIDGILHDYVDGVNHLVNRVVRCVGDPYTRFNEDGLRVLRAIRFWAQLPGFTLHSSTAHEIELYGIRFTEHLSVERVRDELLKILACEQPSTQLEYMRRWGILQTWIPEVDAMHKQDQNRHHRYDVWEHTLHVVDLAPTSPLLRLTALLHDVGKPTTAEVKGCKVCDGTPVDHIYDTSDHTQIDEYSFIEHEKVGAEMSVDICRRLKLSNDDIEYVRTLVRRHLFYYDSSWTDAAVRRFIRKVPVEWLDDLFALCRADRLGHGMGQEDKHGVELMEEFKERCREQLLHKPPLDTKSLAINGKDVMEILKIGPGPRVGEVLRLLQERVLDDPELNTEDQLKQLVAELQHKEVSSAAQH
jgi:tRNA nucleotidyltransferase (CCA-adding enzyme)